MGPSAKLPPSPIFCFTPMFRGSPNGLPRFRSHPARSEVHRTGGIEVNEVNVSSLGEGYFLLFARGFCRLCHAPSSKGNHSSAMAESLWALASAPAFSRSARLLLPRLET